MTVTDKKSARDNINHNITKIFINMQIGVIIKHTFLKES
jgi:hypothetical protein